MHHLRLCLLAVTTILLVATSDVLGQIELRPATENQHSKTKDTDAVKAAKKNRFLRMQRTDTGEPSTLQTAIASFKLADGSDDVVVDLIGAVHVGDKEYYEALNKQFESYDVVLYELVAPKGTRIPKGGRKGSGGNPISMLQGMTQNMLKLSSQMEEVDYTKANFVHADMSPSEIQAAMAKRGESAMTVALDALSEIMKQSNLRQKEALENNESLQQLSADPFSILFDPQRDTKLKIMMAEQFATMGTDMMGDTINRLLVEDRNAAAMEVFARQLAKDHNRIAIFYGAAHLPDFEQRLKEDFGMRPVRTDWLTAWDLTKKSDENAKEDPVNNLFRQLLQPPAKTYQ